MENDDLLPNDGSYFLPREPEEQVRERKKERAKTLEAISVIENLLVHFDERIAYMSNIDAISESLETDPLTHQKAFHVKKLLKQALVEERSLLEDLLQTHKR